MAGKNIKVVVPKINSDLENSLFNNVPSTTIFQISDFSITTNLAPRVVKDFSNNIGQKSQPYTLQTLNVSHDTAISINEKQQKIVFNRDNSELRNYAYFGSSEDYLKSTVQRILTTFPASLYIYTYNNQIQYNTVLNYVYDSTVDIATFNIPVGAVVNKYGLTFISGSTTPDNNLNLDYSNYSIWRSDSGNTEYNILGYSGSSSTTGGTISLKVQGNVFPEAVTAVTIFKSYHIRPNFSIYNHYIATLDILSKYMLSIKNGNDYVFNLKAIIKIDDGGEILVDKNFKWEVSDGYNLDLDTTAYQNFLLDLIDLGVSYDNYKSNLIIRELIPESILLYDNTVNNKSEKLLKSYGHELDQIKSFIDQLAFFHNVTYDKIDNLPDLLVKNLARTLGWETFNIVEEDDLFSHIFGDISESTSEISASYVDIELWRRILINTAWLYKSKGTRKAIEVIFEFIGAPVGLVEINEYIYLASGKIDPNSVTIDFPTGTKPFDNDGYPIAIKEEDFFFFQLSGDTDDGKAYIDLYRQSGFNVNRIVDNKKSWVKDVENIRLSDIHETSYTVNDEKLVINTKEITLSFDIARAIEYDMYTYNVEFDYPVTSTGRTLPYPQLITNNIQVSGLSFTQYIEKVYSSFIDVKSRKVIDDNHGGGYPALYKLYEDYLNVNNPSSNAYTYDKLYSFLKKIDSFWKHFVDQIIPATTILAEAGLKIRNTIFRPQKFVYKHGIDDGSEFAINQPVSVVGDINGITIKSSVIETSKGMIKSYGSNGSYDYSHDSNINNKLIFSSKQNINLQPKYSSTTFSFNVPTWISSGDTKISGCTGNTVCSDAIYCYNNNTEKDIWFNFTGNTDTLTANTGTLFHYKVFLYDKSTLKFDITPVYTKDIPYSQFSGGSLNFTDSIPNLYLNGDQEYLIKGYFTSEYENFSSSTITDLLPYNTTQNFDNNIYPNAYNPTGNTSVERFFDRSLYSGYTGYTFTTEIDYTQTYPGYQYGLYDLKYDYYFVSLLCSQVPVLKVIGSSNPVIQGQYINDSFVVVGENITDFFLTHKPLGSVDVAVNGTSLQFGTGGGEYQLISPTFPAGTYEVVLANPVSASTNDVVTISYLTDGTNTSIYAEFYNVTGITSGGTPSVGTKIFYNTGTTSYEYYLDSGITSVNNVQFNLNGLTLSNGIDFTLSNLNNKKIILNGPIVIGDQIQVYYLVNNNSEVVYTIDSFTPEFDWSIGIPPLDKQGLFSLQIAGYNDTGFTSVLYSTTLGYVINQNIYTDIIDITGASVATKYRARLIDDKYYTTLNNIVITSTTYSNTVIFKTSS